LTFVNLMLSQPLRRPTAELRTPIRPHPEPHRQYGIQTVVLNLSGHLTGAFPANY
jgi:hypothetical protein